MTSKRLFQAGLIVVLALTLSGCGKKATVSDSAKPPAVTEVVETKPEVKGVTIVYGEGGFEPKLATVSAGTAVTFINESAGGMWIKGDSQALEILTAFNQSIRREKGSTYTYTFLLGGEWGYYNQVNPEARGVVSVSED